MSVTLVVLLVTSFPLGAHVFYSPDVWGDVNYEYPLDGVGVFFTGIGIKVPVQVEIGDAFAAVWAISLMVFVISLLGPGKKYIIALERLGSGAVDAIPTNYLLAATKWFAVLVLITFVTTAIENYADIPNEPPKSVNELVRFFEVSKAPLVEEIGFRVMLIGLPLYLIYSRSMTIKKIAKTLWHPYNTLRVQSNLQIFVLITIVSLLFGIAHIISSEPWGFGKVVQATIGGIILGWAYYRYGLVCSLLIHIMANYMILALANSLTGTSGMELNDASAYPALYALEWILIISGISATALVITEYLQSRKLL